MCSMGLWSLPAELVTEICGHWLSIVSIAHLDSACCNHTFRTLILSAAFSENCCREDYEHVKTKYRDELNAWIVLRKAHVPGLYITESLYVEAAAEYFKSHGKLLQYIIFPPNADEEDSADELVADIAKYCCNIRRLETNSSVSSDNFVQIINSCRLLEKVDIGEGEISNSAISELSGLSHLKNLRAWFAEGEDLFITCPTLESVCLHTAPESAMVDDTFGMLLAQSCPRLTALIVEASCITDATVDAIAANCTQLHTFGIASEEITMAALERLTASCPIRWLGVHITPALADRDISTVLRNTPDLTSLNLHNDSDDDLDEWLHAVASHCPNLSSLSLESWCIGDTVDGFAAVAQGCPELKHLDIAAEDQTGEEFCDALSGCKSLVSFRLHQGVTDDVLHALSNCPHLQNVELVDDTERIAEDSTVALAVGCPALERLTLPENSELSMGTFDTLSECCPSLRYFDCRLPKALKWYTEEIAELLPRCEFKWVEEQEDGRATMGCVLF